MSCSQSKGCLYPIPISPVTACELVRTEHIVNTFSKWTPCILAQCSITTVLIMYKLLFIECHHAPLTKISSLEGSLPLVMFKVAAQRNAMTNCRRELRRARRLSDQKDRVKRFIFSHYQSQFPIVCMCVRSKDRRLQSERKITVIFL